jgi:hypothetical protein
MPGCLRDNGFCKRRVEQNTRTRDADEGFKARQSGGLRLYAGTRDASQGIEARQSRSFRIRARTDNRHERKQNKAVEQKRATPA